MATFESCSRTMREDYSDANLSFFAILDGAGYQQGVIVSFLCPLLYPFLSQGAPGKDGGLASIS